MSFIASSSLLFLLFHFVSTFRIVPLSWRNQRPPSLRALLSSVEKDFTRESGFLSDEIYDEEEPGNVHIPSTGVSVSDAMHDAQKERFVTEVVPIKGLAGVAQLVSTAAVRGSFEPVRYLVALSPLSSVNASADDETTGPAGRPTSFVMVDVPPFSQQLVTRLQAFMGINGSLAAILVTSRDAIHYDESPSVYSIRRADLDLWGKTFPNAQVVTYRLDTPRDCRPIVTQCLDGYGPFAAQESVNGTLQFVETGRPLTIEKWDFDVAQNVLSGKAPPDDLVDAGVDDSAYSPEAIRAREAESPVLAIFTPGHSFGSMSYVFPRMKVCCSGFTLPVEDTRVEENMGIGTTGPALDCRGYITTSQAGIGRQMESAKSLVNTYSDRFHVLLPSRGDPLFVDGNSEERRRTLLDIIRQFEAIGKIYEELGITSSEGIEL